MKRLLITGGSGYLGQHLVARAVKGHQVLYTYFSHDPAGLSNGVWLDIRNWGAVRDLVKNWLPDVIIHTSGSNRSQDMKSVICQGAENVTKVAAEIGTRLIHISTDVVFDGKRAPYREADLPSPIHAYGEAKATAESVVAGYDDHVIIRTSLIYGLEMMDHSTEWTVKALSAGENVTLFVNQIRNPVWINTLCLACLELTHMDFRGIMNVAGQQAMSRADFGMKMLDWWGISERESLVTGLSSEGWPTDCRLDLTLASTVLDTPLPGVDAVLQRGLSDKREW